MLLFRSFRVIQDILPHYALNISSPSPSSLSSKQKGPLLCLECCNVKSASLRYECQEK